MMLVFFGLLRFAWSPGPPNQWPDCIAAHAKAATAALQSSVLYMHTDRPSFRAHIYEGCKLQKPKSHGRI